MIKDKYINKKQMIRIGQKTAAITLSIFFTLFLILFTNLPIIKVTAQSIQPTDTQQGIQSGGTQQGIQPGTPAAGNANTSATTPCSTNSPCIPNPIAGSAGTVCQLVSSITNIVTELGAVIAVLFIIWSGFLFISAQGNESKLKDAKRTFYTTLVGTAVLLGASVIAQIIFNTINAVMSPSTGSSKVC